MADEARKVITLTDPAPQYALLEFDKKAADARLLWADLLERTHQFTVRYEADTDPVWLFQSLNEAFFGAKDDWLIIADVDHKAFKLVGHMIAQAQPYGRLGTVVFVHQLEHDVYGDPMLQQGWARVREWAAAKNIRLILNFARTQAVARLYRQKYGFEDRRVLQTYDLLKRRD